MHVNFLFVFVQFQVHLVTLGVLFYSFSSIY